MLYLVLLLVLLGLLIIKFHKKSDLNRLGFSNLLNVRGILAILIILHHLAVNQGLMLSNNHPFYVLPHLGYLCVGVFFFLSGYGIECKKNENEKYLNKLPIKCVYLLIVYLFYNFIYFIFYPLYGIGECLSKSLLGLINGNPLAGSSWFLLDLSLLYVSIYISRNMKHRLLGMLMIQVLLLFFLYFMNYRVVWYYSNFCFPLGVVFRKCQSMINKSNVRVTLLLLACFILLLSFVLSINEKYMMKTIYSNLSAMSFSVIIMMMCLYITFRGGIAKFIGKYSLEIFLIHVLLYKVLRGNYIYIADDFIYSTIVVISSLIVALPLSLMSKTIKKMI